MRQLTDEERGQVVTWYKELKNISMVIRMFRKTFHRHPPSRDTIKRWVDHYLEGGSVARVPKRKRTNTLVQGEIGYGVVGAFEANPDLGIRQAARMFDVSCSTIRRILDANSIVAQNAEKWKAKLKKSAEDRAKKREEAKEDSGSDAAPESSRSYSHLLRLLKIKKYQHHKTLLRCSYCSYKSQFRSCMIAHEKEHEKYNEVGRRQPKRCPTCKAEVPDRRTLKSHAEKHKLERLQRANPVIRVQCPTTGKQSETQVICFPAKELPFLCSKSKETFSTREKLNKHVRCEEDEKPYECNLCPASFKTSVTLKKHTKTHLKEYKCSTCRTVFKQEHHLVLHANAHNGKTPYCCHVCRQPFKSSFSLRSHMRKHRRQVVEKEQRTETGVGEAQKVDQVMEQGAEQGAGHRTDIEAGKEADCIAVLEAKDVPEEETDQDCRIGRGHGTDRCEVQEVNRV